MGKVTGFREYERLEEGYEPVPQVPGPLGGLGRELHGGSFGAVVEVHDHPIDNFQRRWLPP